MHRDPGVLSVPATTPDNASQSPALQGREALPQTPGLQAGNGGNGNEARINELQYTIWACQDDIETWRDRLREANVMIEDISRRLRGATGDEAERLAQQHEEQVDNVESLEWRISQREDQIRECEAELEGLR